MDALAQKLPKGIKQLFTMDVVQKSNHKLMAVPFMVLMHYVITSEATKRHAFTGGHTWKNDLFGRKKTASQIVSSCRTPSMREQRKRPHSKIWGQLIGDLASQEGDTGVMYTLSFLCANSLRRDTEIADKYIGTAMD